MRNILFIIMLVSLRFVVFAQTLTINKILNSAKADIDATNLMKLAKTTADLRFHSPIFNNIEARIGFSGSALGDTIYGYLRNEDVYGLQFKTNNFKEIQWQKKYKSALVSSFENEADYYLSEAIFERYLLCVNWYYNVKKLSDAQLLKKLFELKREAIKINAELGLPFKINDVIDVENDLLKINEDIIKLTSEQSNFINKAKSYMNSDTGFVMLDTSNFISINELINWDSEATSSIQTLIDYKKSKSNLAYTEERYINSQGRNIFTFARVGLENPLYLTRPNKFNTLNNFGVKIGLQVPITGNNNFKHSKALIDLREAELEIQKTTAQLDTKKAYLKAKLKVLLANRNSLNHLLNQSLIPKLLADKDLKATISPLDSYDMQINVETLKSHFIDNDEEIMLNYIELLYYQGLLSKQPFINYLSKNLENW